MQSQQTLVPDVQKTADSVLQAFCDTWNRHDVEAMGELFAADADFVNVLGMHFKGKQEIAAVHAELHKERFARTHIRNLQSEITYLSPDIALAHVRWKMTGDLAVAGEGIRRGTMTHVLVRKGERWFFRATQNTDIVFLPEFASHPLWSKYV